MAKYYGKLGFVITKEDDEESGKFVPTPIEKVYYGDVIENVRRWERAETPTVNDDLNVTNRISVVADSFASKNLGALRYAEFMGVMWNVKTITVAYPRLVLNLGDLYNGPTVENSQNPSQKA